MTKQQIQKLTEEEHTKKIERVACYIRVSTQEQKIHGISLDSQRDKLKEYAEKHGLKIVGWYEDEGVSGGKLIKNRPELQRMLNDAQKNKFDRILFIKLDRFFRSVAEYHECMKIIYPVLWTATEEKYDLTTANGRAFVNMKLTIGEYEADQTGERINIVNDYKIKTGQAITGAQRQGLAFTVKLIDGVKRVVQDPETKDVVSDYISHFLRYQNKNHARQYVNNKYGTSYSYSTLSKVLSDTKIYGYYHGNSNYCEPYITKKEFDQIQNVLSKNIKRTPSSRVYIFTGLIECPECGRKLSSKYTEHKYGKYYNYRCNRHYINKFCDFNKQLNEKKIEEFLVDNLDSQMKKHIENAAVKDNKANKDNESINKRITAIKSEMTKVKRMYRKEDITETEYDAEMADLKNTLRELESHLEPTKERDLTVYSELVNSDWKSLYNALSRENKRAFWRKLLKGIKVDKDGVVFTPIFF